jgi:hypothetical protein
VKENIKLEKINKKGWLESTRVHLPDSRTTRYTCRKQTEKDCETQFPNQHNVSWWNWKTINIKKLTKEMTRVNLNYLAKLVIRVMWPW